MMLIVAAMDEELHTALDLCAEARRVSGTGLPLWRARTPDGTDGPNGPNDNEAWFLRAGVGPKKAATRLREALSVITPERILVAGYAGGLDPALRPGDLVVVTRATPFALNQAQPDWDHVETATAFDLADTAFLAEHAAHTGRHVSQGAILSSRHVLGSPAHKALLFRRFQAAVVDMETAFLAREAAARGIALGALRAISDTATDSFLEPFETDPAAGLTARARKLLATPPVSAWKEWKNNAATARDAMRQFWFSLFGIRKE